MTNTNQTTLTFGGAYHALLRHKWRASGFFLFVMVGVTTFTIFCPRVYQSEGKLFVRVGRENATLDPTATLGKEPTVTIPSSRENEINTVVEMLKSRPIIEHVVDQVGSAAILKQGTAAPAGPAGTQDNVQQKVGQARDRVSSMVSDLKVWVEGLSPNPSGPADERERAVAAVTASLTVKPVRKSNIINIGYQGASPELSKDVVAEVIAIYLDQHARLNRADGAHAFFAEQKSEMLDDLVRKQERLRDLRNQTGPVSLDGQREVVVGRIAAMEDELAQVESGIAASEAKTRVLQEKLETSPETEAVENTSGIGDDGTDDIRSQFYALQVQQQEAEAKYTEDHPKLRQLREQVAEAEKILQAETPTRIHKTERLGQVHQAAKLALLEEEPLLASLSAKRTALETQLAEAREQWKVLNERDLQLAELQREVELCEANYQKYATNFEQTRIDQALQEEKISNINVLQPATYEVKPVYPRKLLNLALGFLVGAFGGLCLALLADSRDRPILSPEEVETRLDLPTLVSIPRFKRKQLVLNGRN